MWSHDRGSWTNLIKMGKNFSLCSGDTTESSESNLKMEGRKREREGGRERVRKERDSRRKKRREGVEWMNSDLKFTSSSRNEVSSNSLSRFS